MVGSVYCNVCGRKMSPVYFTDIERDRHGMITGRQRKAVSHLLCDGCGHEEIVDDSMDSPWEYPRARVR